MIQANELRIGNLVSPDPFRYGTVINFNEKRIKLKLQHSTLDRFTDTGMIGLDVEGIPLSEEWLIKLGFEKKEGNNCFYFERNDLSINLKNESLGWDDTYNGFYDSCDFHTLDRCRYIHQLQNLYFALSGKELTINQ